MFPAWNDYIKISNILVVGAGLSGGVIGQQASERSGLKTLIIDKRNHVGGNCFDYIDKHGIRLKNCLNIAKRIARFKKKIVCFTK